VPEGVGDIQVVELRIWVPLPNSGRLIIVADVEKSKIKRNGSSISLIGARVGRPPLDGEIGLQSWNVHLLDIGPGVYKQDLRCSCARRKSIDTFLDGGE
jgi:hypothetical protein